MLQWILIRFPLGFGSIYQEFLLDYDRSSMGFRYGFLGILIGFHQNPHESLGNRTNAQRKSYQNPM